MMFKINYAMVLLLVLLPAYVMAGTPSDGTEHHVYIHLVDDAVDSSGAPVQITIVEDAVSQSENPATVPALEQVVEGAEDAAPKETQMGLLLFVFVLAIFLGIELISKVPSQLHTPLMSGSNAVSGITIVGALLAAGRGNSRFTIFLGVLAVALAMINVVGGYLVTDRMLGMFKHKGGGQS